MVYFLFRDFEQDVIKADMNPKLTVFYRTALSDLNNQSTEIMPHNPNPDWMNVFKFMYEPGEVQVIT